MTERPLAATWGELAQRGWLTGGAFEDRAAELAAVRTVAAGGLGAGRVFDGHRNGLERLLVHASGAVPVALRTQLARGELAVGVWGADPADGEGEPAWLDADGRTVTGVKTFCSGAGLVDVALVLVHATAQAAGPRELALVDLRDPARVELDRHWFAVPALAESHSHRVVFDEAPVLALLGGDALMQEPWISGDALRSAAVWAGAADSILARMLAGPPGGEEAIGRAAAIVAGADAWLADGLRALEDAHAGAADVPWPRISALRLELSARLRVLVRLSAEHGGSRALVRDPALQEFRDGLTLLLLQHRLGPVARRLGEARRDASGVTA